MYIDPKDWMDQAYFLGSYEVPLVRLLAALIKPGDACVDIGAQKGYITLHLAALVGPRGKVLAFEPDRGVFEALVANCEANNVDWVTGYPLALAETTGEKVFAFNSQPGSGSFFPNKFAAPGVTCRKKVPVTTLDQVLQSMASHDHRIRLVKIDAEGAEPLILQGMAATIESHRPIIILEVNYDSLTAGGFQPENVETLLRSAGYQFYALAARRDVVFRQQPVLVRLVTLKKQTTTCMNVVATPIESQAVPSWVIAG